MKLCVDCKHYRPHELHGQTVYASKLGRCARKGIPSPVDGSPDDPPASIERTHMGTCGIDGLHFVRIAFPHQDPKPHESQDMDTFGRILKEGT